MCLGHVYIVLEPVGSARLTFDDDLYYEFIYFDAPKVVRSPGCDHGLDEESRNGRDINIDILDNYIWTPKRFRVRLGQYRITGRLSEPPGGLLGLLLGNVAEIQKFPTCHQDLSMERLATRERGVHLHTLVDRERKRSRERG